MGEMADRSGEAQSQLYLLRIWIGLGPAGSPCYRGKLQPVLGDDSYCFSGATELLTLLANLFPGAASATNAMTTADPGPAIPEPPPAQES